MPWRIQPEGSAGHNRLQAGLVRFLWAGQGCVGISFTLQTIGLTTTGWKFEAPLEKEKQKVQLQAGAASNCDPPEVSK